MSHVCLSNRWLGSDARKKARGKGVKGESATPGKERFPEKKSTNPKGKGGGGWPRSGRSASPAPSNPEQPENAPVRPGREQADKRRAPDGSGALPTQFSAAAQGSVHVS